MDINITKFKEQGVALWNQALEIWRSGGWSMIPIAVIALFMFTLGMHIYLKLWQKRHAKTKEKVWRKWIDQPEKRKGPIGKILNFVTGGNTIQDTQEYFRELRTIETAHFQRDLKVMKICVTAAPLVGLLGTVTGMLSTFNALSSGSGGDQTMQMVAKGISEALITTETGLVIALPGLFFQHKLARDFQRYNTFLAHLETVCTQIHYKAINKMAQIKPV